jgi:integrase
VVLAKLEDYWLKLRLKDLDVPAAHLLNESGSISADMPTMDDAKHLYLKLKGEGRSKLFSNGADRNVTYLNTCIGSKTLDRYSTSDAAIFRDWLLNEQKVSATTVQRVFSSIKAIFNLAVGEFGLDIRNPFASVYLPAENGQKRDAIPTNLLKTVQSACMESDDDLRHLVALISDTGLRLAEAAGLHKSDIHLDRKDGAVPHLVIRKHKWRPLKTSTSERVVPLVGASLWAAERIVLQPSEFCFPRYTNGERCNSNSASASLNKWLKSVAGSSYVIHALRHSFRDRLRAIDAPVDLIDQLGGWSLQTVGQSYGEGYELEKMWEYMLRIELD